MADNIIQYRSDEPVAQANNMVADAAFRNAATARRLGGAVSDLVDTGFAVARQVQEHRAIEESANLAGELATKGADIDEKIRQAKANADPYSEDFQDWAATTKEKIVDPIVETFGQNARTREGQRQAALLRAKLGGMYYTKLHVDQSEISGVAAADSIRTMGNQIVKDVADDPSTFEIGIGKIDLLISGLVQSGFPREQADELKRSLFAATGVSAFKSAAEINPVKAQRDWDAGRYAQYIPANQQDELRSYPERQQTLLDAERKRRVEAADKAHRDAGEELYSQAAVGLKEDPTKVDIVKIGRMKGPDGRTILSGEHVNSLIRLQNEEIDRQKKGAGGDPEENKGPGFWDTYSRVLAGGFKDPMDIYKLAGNGKPLTLLGANTLFELARKKTADEKVGNFDTQRMTRFFTLMQRDISTDRFGRKRQGGDDDAFKFYMDKSRQIEDLRAKGKSLDQLLSPDSPDYVGKDWKNYIPPPPADTYVPPVPEKPRSWFDFFGSVLSGGPAFNTQELDAKIKNGDEGRTAGLAALKAAIAAGQITKEAAKAYGLKREWLRASGKTTSTVPLAK